MEKLFEVFHFCLEIDLCFNIRYFVAFLETLEVYRTGKIRFELCNLIRNSVNCLRDKCVRLIMDDRDSELRAISWKLSFAMTPRCSSSISRYSFTDLRSWFAFSFSFGSTSILSTRHGGMCRYALGIPYSSQDRSLLFFEAASEYIFFAAIVPSFLSFSMSDAAAVDLWKHDDMILNTAF